MPRLEILGVYRPLVSAETWREQWRITDNDDLTRAHFEKLVLIEAEVEGLTEPLKMGRFGQMQPKGPAYTGGPAYPSHMQCGYDEGVLSLDGEALVERKMNCIHGTGRLRFGVYLHYYDPEKQLLWEFGEVTCPPVADAPVRLLTLLPYRAVR
jgi:hypothetical protein